MYIVFINLNKEIHITVMINVYFYLTCTHNDRSQINISNKIYTHRELDCGEYFCVTSSFVKYRAPGIKIKFGEMDECITE